MKATVINQLPVDLSIARDNVISPGAELLVTFDAEFWADIQLAENKGWLTVSEWWTDDGVRHEQALASQPPEQTGEPPEQTGQPPELTSQPPELTSQPPEQTGEPPEQTSQPPAADGDATTDGTQQRGRRKAQTR